MREGRKRRYWDSCVFIALIVGEEGRAATVQTILEAAERGETDIVTSALTLVEVVKTPERQRPTSEKDEALIRAYFQHDFITVVPFTKELAVKARELYWRQNVEPKDAVHIACAVDARADVMETYDEKPLNLDNPPLEITEPRYEGTLPMDLGNDQFRQYLSCRRGPAKPTRWGPVVALIRQTCYTIHVCAKGDEGDE